MRDVDDDVTYRRFESSFEQKSSIAETGSYRASDNEWITLVTQGRGKTPVRMIEEMLLSIWGKLHSEKATRVVGEVSGSEITSIVTSFSRMEREQPDL